MDDRDRISRPARVLRLAEELAVSALHQRSAAADGATDAVPQMISGITPVGLHAVFPKQRRRYLAMGCADEPAVERLENEGEAPTARFIWEMATVQMPRSVEFVQAPESAQTWSDMVRLNQRLC